MILVALAVTGIALGHWESTAYTNGVISSGSFNIVVSDEGITSSCPTYAPLSSVSLGDTVTDTITDAFPGLVVNGTINFFNIGTIPGYLTNWTVLAYDSDTFPIGSGSDEAFAAIASNFTTAGSAIWNDTTGNLGGAPSTTQQWMVNWWWTFANGTPITVFGGWVYPGQAVLFNYDITFLEGLKMGGTWYFNVTATFAAASPMSTVVIGAGIGTGTGTNAGTGNETGTGAGTSTGTGTSSGCG